MFVFFTIPAIADVDEMALIEVQGKVDQEYYPKLGNGEFQELILEVSNQYNELSFAGVYYVGEHEGLLLRPAFFKVINLENGNENVPLDIEFVAMYADTFLRNLLQNHEMEYLNPQIMQDYAKRNGIKNNEFSLVFPTDIASYSSPLGFDVIVFGMVDYAAMSMNVNEMLIDWELFALVRFSVDYGSVIENNCYIITDQEDVRQILVALDPEPDSIGGIWIYR